jgi:dihydroneopterin aldolase
MDKIILRNMKFYAYHGVLPEENSLGQNFYIDLDLYRSLVDAGKTDKLDESVNYAEVYQLVEKVVSENTFKLIEKLASEVAKEILFSFEVESVWIRVKKPGAPISGNFDHVGVEIVRRKSDYE